MTTLHLAIRPAVFSLPSYSLTGDLLGFLRCGLQYRYTRIGQLPSTRPVQLWFGQFIHGVLEEAYRRYDASVREGDGDLPPWPEADLAEIFDFIQRRLAAQGLFPWDANVQEIGRRRAVTAVNELGPLLFPLIHRAEVRLTGARDLPLALIPRAVRFRAADRYEMVGVIDVITHVALTEPTLAENPLVRAIVEGLPPNPPELFEVIVDYKGMRRPPSEADLDDEPSLWDIYGWQVQTYAHLRSSHADALPVVTGVIIYLNELQPTRSDLVALKRELREGTTDVLPAPGSQDERRIRAWSPRAGESVPELSFAYRLRRALRLVTISPGSIDQSLVAFDDVVARIEVCRGCELRQGRVLSTWEQNPADQSTCTACDARTFCPANTREDTPQLPRVRAPAATGSQD